MHGLSYDGWDDPEEQGGASDEDPEASDAEGSDDSGSQGAADSEGFAEEGGDVELGPLSPVEAATTLEQYHRGHNLEVRMRMTPLLRTARSRARVSIALGTSAVTSWQPAANGDAAADRCGYVSSSRSSSVRCGA